MVFTRGSSEEYDAWAEFAGDKSWSWSGLLPYMQKSEKFSKVPVNPYPGISPGQAAHARENLAHIDGFRGPIVVGLSIHLLGARLLNATPALGIVQRALL